jgi:NTE family protein
MYLSEIEPRIKSELTGKDLARTGFLLLLHPRNWRYLFSRANVLSKAIERCWGIQQCLSDLPRIPVWSINGTTAETGRRFRFKLDRCGDYELGYADAGSFRVADAMAVSAALPGAVGPLALKVGHYQWRKRPSWDAPSESEKSVVIPYERLHLYDGGLYDNLALESLMDAGTQSLKGDIQYLVCSDAGAPLKRVGPGLSLSPFRALRILEIAMDQAHALRVRSLANFLERNPGAGAYAQIGSNPVERIEHYRLRNPVAAEELLRLKWLDKNEVAMSAGLRTTLSPLTDEQFDRLERHGYECLRWNEYLFRPRPT